MLSAPFLFFLCRTTSLHNNVNSCHATIPGSMSFLVHISTMDIALRKVHLEANKRTLVDGPQGGARRSLRAEGAARVLYACVVCTCACVRVCVCACVCVCVRWGEGGGRVLGLRRIRVG